MDIQRDDDGGAPTRPSPRLMKAMLAQAATQWPQLVHGEEANTIGHGDVVEALVAKGWSAEFHHMGLVLASEKGGTWHVVGASGEKVVALRAGGGE